MRLLSILLACALSTVHRAQTSGAPPLCETFEVTRAVGEAQEWISLDSEGDLVVAGFVQTGTVSIYRRCGNALLEQQVLVGSAADRYGVSVLLHGEWLFVGTQTSSVGSVYVYRDVGGTWTLSQVLNASNGTPADIFGLSFDADGDTLIVGAPNANFSYGLCYEFERQGSTWVETDILVPSCVFTFGLFGYDLSLRGDVLAVGSPTENQIGTVRIFQRGISGWALVHVEPSPGFQYFDYASVLQLADESTLFVRSLSNGVQVLEEGPFGWAPVQVITNPAGGFHADFIGNSMAVSEDGAVVALGSERLSLSDTTGGVYSFVDDGGAWVLDGLFTDDDPEQRDYLGGAVTICGDTLVAASAGSQFATDTPKLWGASLSNTGCARLSASLDTISLSAGASATLALDFGPAQAGSFYHLLGSVGGNDPPVLLGSACVPLVLDAYFLQTITPDVPPLSGNSGLLDASGRGSVGLLVPPGSDPSLAGLVVQHAAVSYTLRPLAFHTTSNPVAIALVP